MGGMDIDHHNPKLKAPERNRYDNLFLSTRHCNGKKGDRWPTQKQKDLYIRFLNPCTERDYGVHLFEDPETFEIWGATRAGKYHVRMLDLNADHLIRERQRRNELRKLAENKAIFEAIGVGSSTLKSLRALQKEIEEMIPPLPQKKKPSD
jgi:hypothetical protein